MREEIEVPKPEWGSHLTDVILNLEKLRAPTLRGSVPPFVFWQLKAVFHMLETLGSARIEGNNTTLADYVESKLDKQRETTDPHRELENLEKAILFVEDTLEEDTPINRAFISELHKIVTVGLDSAGEGSRYPGQLRPVNVTISQSKHTPPDVLILAEKFEAYLNLINKEQPISNQLLTVAIAHHRFAHIHPFDNGNGRLGRILSYALLIKSGFNVKKGGRLMNPSAVFYTNREEYYERLSAADSLSDKDLLNWSEYYLDGLLDAIKKVDKLLSREYIQAQILLPALTRARGYQRIRQSDLEILKFLITKPDMSIKAEELGQFGYKTSKEKSYVVSQMKNADLLTATRSNGRIYTINIVGKAILRDVMEILKKEGFVAEFLEKN